MREESYLIICAEALITKVINLIKDIFQTELVIEERPEIINNRKRLGDYEIDLIVGQKNKGAILSIIDRVSRSCILQKLNSKSSSEVSCKVVELLKLSKTPVLSITSDNGSEFTNHKFI